MAAALIAAAAAVPPAAALAGDGSTVLRLDGPAARELRGEGVSLAPQRPARGGAQRVELPVASGLAGSTTTLLSHRGSILLRKGDRRLRLARLRLTLSKRSQVSARVGGEDLTLFKVLRGGRRDVDPASGAVDLAGLRLKLTPEAARAIAARLGLAKLRPKRFATLSATLQGLISSGTPETPKQAAASGCPLPSGAGPEPQDPLPFATRPPAAVDITAASIDWHVRESFIRYINTGEGTSVSGGASGDPAVLRPGASVPLTYTFHFPFASGWQDAGANPSDPADDTALVKFGGGVRFLYSAHGIDLTPSEPEIEIDGASSRAIFSIDDGSTTKRQVLVNLDLSRAAQVTASGNSFTYDRVPGAIPSGTAATVFGGFYSPGTDFGCFSLSFSTQ